MRTFVTLFFTGILSINLFALQYQRSFIPGSSVHTNETIRVKVTFYNNQGDAIKGLVYTEQVPVNVTVNPVNVRINNLNYGGFTFERGSSGEITANRNPARWIFQTPPDFPENGLLLPGDSAVVEYDLTCDVNTSFSYNYDSWYAGLVTSNTLQPMFGFDSLNTVTINFSPPVGNQPPLVSNIPNQTINEGQSFATISLDNYVADQDNPDNGITWTYSGNTQLTVNINASRVAAIVIPNPDWNGSETIIFTAIDPGGLSDSDPATFTVNAVNDPPVVSNIPNQTVNERQTFATISLDNYVADPDNPDNGITWTYSGNTQLTVNINSSRVATIVIPNPDWNGSETITFTATDPGGLSDSDPATFTVNAVNDPPVVSNIPNQTINEGQSFATIALDNYVADPDNPDNGITWTYSGNTQLTVNINASRIATIVIPNSNWNGSETITFTATDQDGLSDSDPATFTVTPDSNLPPTQVQNLRVTNQ